MNLTQAVLTVPSHMVPGGMPQPDLKQLGFNDFERCSIIDTTKLTRFEFSRPTKHATEAQFDEAIEQFIWFFAKGTPYVIDKTFADNTPDSHHRYYYTNNERVCEAIIS
ncbi:hypothetical protein UA38_02375 [Photobacterium kishitanii]|uniref:Uncharacterized protein n=1 Tax=Photobacterium kishitanii TaxID=318456 RepID=A0A2T3QZP9_9GAMM|nr:hypothetical protein [Photobacterium kishitanii]KJG10984.1 hypothetical protein UB40_06640 [Photobacterium kishitanii]KJG59989.1 hypothetical protein UA38_02375 [Photobacterium kishitanii]KJG63272.1 hypothetical protein UA42_02760 [Photobacterium kishitanii]KJG67721.1 hypothetical protein UA40_00080 [Photobacterium kishitanii]KJG71442.1 hypothetical protein UA41_02395 [Photobacterium kishitanii]